LLTDALQKFTAGEFTIFGPKATATIFTTFPPEHISNYTAFIEVNLLKSLLTTTTHQYF
jgi:hypothetical protein